jgi:hypothetical protein
VVPLQYICKRLIVSLFLLKSFSVYIGSETDQGEYIQRLIDSFPLDKLVITWIQFLTILQNPSECGDVSVDRNKREGDLIERSISLGFSSNAKIC